MGEFPPLSPLLPLSRHGEGSRRGAGGGLQLGAQHVNPPLLDARAEAAATPRGLPGLRDTAPPCRVAVDLVRRAETVHMTRDVPHDEHGERHGGAVQPPGRGDVEHGPETFVAK